MPTEKEMLAIQKAMAYDLQEILDEQVRAGKETLTAEEMKALIKAYIKGAAQ